MRKKKEFDIALEESLSEHIASTVDMLEVPLSERAIRGLGVFVLCAGIVVVGRVLVLASSGSEIYGPRATLNLVAQEEIPAPRGIIYDRMGDIFAENQPSFFLFLNLKEFLRNAGMQEETLREIEESTGLTPDDVWDVVRSTDIARSPDRILLSTNVPQAKTVRLKDLNIPTLSVESGFRRVYPEGAAFGALLGYTGLVNVDDLKKNQNLSYKSIVGRSGVEAAYNDLLTGTSGKITKFRDAKGNTLQESGAESPRVGNSLSLTIDGEFQKYFFERLRDGLASLGRSVGVGLAINPQNGEVLALVNLPSFDNNVFLDAAKSKERQELLVSPLMPLFDRAVSGLYNPGSTIKPLVGVAALKEGVIDTTKEIYSPGYLDVPNPYFPDQPSRFLDWRPQGYVNLKNAIAQSSNVYFYTVGGGFGDVKGLGISRLREWWHTFKLDEPTGIDLPGESSGVLPDPDARKQKTGRQWLLGDTYNASIGQGDLAVTPLELLNYIGAIANGGTLYKPHVGKDVAQEVIGDLSYLAPEIAEVQKGMRAAVTSPLGTANTLSVLPFSIGAKTGSAQIQNNTKVNAFFVGYAPFEDPQIAILVLVENAREGSLNAVPVAKDVLNWYYENRMRK